MATEFHGGGSAKYQDLALTKNSDMDDVSVSEFPRARLGLSDTRAVASLGCVLILYGLIVRASSLRFTVSQISCSYCTNLPVNWQFKNPRSS